MSSPDQNPDPKDAGASPGASTLPECASFEGFLSSYSQPEYLAAAFGLTGPRLRHNYCLSPDTNIVALIQRDGYRRPFFRTVRWRGDSDSHDSARYGRHVRACPVHRRCLVPLDGFFIKGGDSGQWHCIRPVSPASIFVVAAILDPHYEVKGDPDNHPIVLMTMPAPPLMPGMEQTYIPLALYPPVWKRWIEPGKLTKDDVEEVARSCEKVRMTLQTVGSDCHQYKPDGVRSATPEEESGARYWGMEAQWMP